MPSPSARGKQAVSQRSHQLRESEHSTQAALIEWCARMTPRYPELAEIFAVPNGGQRHPVVAAKLKAEGVQPGIEDLMLLVPRGGYHGLLIELKVPGGRVPEAQRVWHARHRARGYCVMVCWGWEQAADMLVKYLTAKPWRLAPPEHGA